MHLAAANAVYRHGERLDQGALFPRHTVGQRVAADGAALHTLGKSAAFVFRLVEALTELSLPAIPALRAGQPVPDRFDRHPLPEQAAFYPAADFDDFARDLVTKGDGVGFGFVGVHEQVGAADAGGTDADDNVLGAGLRGGEVGQRHGVVAVEESGFHHGHEYSFRGLGGNGVAVWAGGVGGRTIRASRRVCKCGSACCAKSPLP